MCLPEVFAWSIMPGEANVSSCHNGCTGETSKADHAPLEGTKEFISHHSEFTTNYSVNRNQYELGSDIGINFNKADYLDLVSDASLVDLKAMWFVYY